MVKMDKFKDKPKPPSRDEIMSDISSAPSGDALFTIDFPGGHLPSAGQDDTAAASSSATDTTSVKPDKAVIDKTYKQVSRLLELHSKLREEPKLLQTQYEQLEKLGEDVSQSISELKSAAETVVKKS